MDNDNYTQEEPIRLYSHKAIQLAVFIGSPIAGGFLLKRNFENLDRPKHGLIALWSCIAFTLLMFLGIFLIPDDILDRIPNLLFTIIYMGLMYLFTQKYLGEELEQHREQNGQFYSMGRAAGIGALSLVAVLVFIFAMVFFVLPDDFDAALVEDKLVQFDKNEVKALEILNLPFVSSDSSIAEYFANVSNPLWEENLKILDEIEAVEKKPAELLKLTSLLREYSTLRIQFNNNFYLHVFEDSLSHKSVLDSIDKEMLRIANELQNM